MLFLIYLVDAINRERLPVLHAVDISISFVNPGPSHTHTHHKNLFDRICLL